MLKAFALALALTPHAAQAAHCACGGEAFPGAAISAQTVGAGSTALTLGFGFSTYEDADRAGLLARAARPDSAGRSLGPRLITAQTLGLSWGLGEAWQLAVQSGFKRVEGFREARLLAGGAVLLDHGDLEGATDTELQLKARLAQGAWGALALAGGLTLPTGQGARSAAAEPDPVTLSPTAQPASLPAWALPARRSLDGSLALAYSVERGPWSLDLSLQQSIPASTRGQQAGARSTVAVSGGLGLREHDRLWLDLLWARADADTDDGRQVPGSGGAFASLGPRYSLSLSPRLTLTLDLKAPLLYALAGADEGQSGLRAQWQGAARIQTLF